MIKINISPTYSKLATQKEVEELGIKLPEDWILSQHQVDTYKAFLDPEIKVIFNTAMTGDGKSLSAYLPMINGKNPIAMYPTNELINDQNKNLKKYPNITEKMYTLLHSKEISDKIQNTSFENRREFIESLFSRYNVQAILTNPDLFHLMMTHQYGVFGHDKKFNWQGQQLPYLIPNRFDYFIFDEFHIFEVPQIVSVINILNYIEAKKEDYNKKYIFLSATPKDSFINLLERSDMKISIIEGSYSDKEQIGYREILQKISLEINFLNQDKKTYDWLVENLDLIKNEFSNGKSKGAIIVESIALAKKIFHYLKKELSNIRVIENTGLSNDDEKKLFRESEFDLVVATSTVDIGVDFKINFLIFEAFSQGSFLQRLGRLGRHKGFESYKAFSLIPKIIYERLEKYKDTEVNRVDFNNTIKNVFSEYNDFKPYINKWGILQSAQILASLDSGKDNYKDLRNKVAEKFNRIYFNSDEINMDKYVRKFHALSNDSDKKLIIEELNKFRGGGKFDCAIFDKTDGYIKKYDLFFLLKNTEFEVITESEFNDKYNKNQETLYNPKFYILLNDYKDKTDSYSIKFDGYIHDEYSNYINEANVISGLVIEDVKNTSMNKINKIISKEKILCFISDIKARELKERYRLPIHFPIFNLSDDTNDSFCIAFGKEALLLDSILWWKKSKKDGFFCC
jgi:CRISPR-associated endonuclease/helicase Cas3